MTDETWSTPEIVRTLQKLADAVERLNERLDTLGTQYVRKEIYDLGHAEFLRRIDLIGEEQVNLAADLSRHHKEHAENQRSAFTAFVAPVMTGVLVAIVVFILAHIH